MADWFETRFRELRDAGGLDPAFAARMRDLVVEEWRRDASTSRNGVDVGGGTRRDEGDVVMLDVDDPTIEKAPKGERERSPGRWLLAVAALVLVVVVAGVFGGPDDSERDLDTAAPAADSVPAQPTRPYAQSVLDVGDFEVLQPGRYFIDPDGDDSTRLRVTFEVAAEGWQSWIGVMKADDDGHVALSITTVDNVVRDGCLDHRPLRPAVGPTVDDLALALSQLPPFRVTAPSTDVTILGYQGRHLQLTVPDLPVTGVRNDRLFDECAFDSLHSWFAPNLGGSFHGYNGEPGRTEDFWILDVGGTRLVLVMTTSPESPADHVAELQAIFDSIRIEP